MIPILTLNVIISLLSHFVTAGVIGATTSFHYPDCEIFKRKWRRIDAGGISECSGCSSVYIFVHYTIHHVQIHNRYICCARTSRNQRHDLHKGTHTTRLSENTRLWPMLVHHLRRCLKIVITSWVHVWCLIISPSKGLTSRAESGNSLTLWLPGRGACQYPDILVYEFYFSSFEAGIANAISSFKWRKIHKCSIYLTKICVILWLRSLTNDDGNFRHVW